MMYSSKFLEDICNRAGVKSAEDRRRFTANIAYAGDLYLHLKFVNPKTPNIAKQKALLKQYHAALAKTKSLYDKIQKDNVCESRLSLSLRGEYNALPPEMQERIASYINASGRHEPLFSHALELHLHASKTAVKIPYIKKPEKEALLQWLLFLRTHWPEKAKAKFGLGNYYKELGGYKSPALDILFDLMQRISDKTMHRVMMQCVLQYPVYDRRILIDENPK